MTGIAIFSLDCEGKWGVADHLHSIDNAAFADARLREAYRHVNDAFDSVSVPATFAFVGLFTLERAELNAIPLSDLAQEVPYLREVARSIAADEEGWVGDWAPEMVGANHELAFHGATHTPWSMLSREQASIELDLLGDRVAGGTFVFPRNEIAYTDLLRERGVLGYRASRSTGSRLRRFSSELNLLTAADELDPPRSRPIEIPAGYFVNWLAGIRRLVPPSVTQARARHILADAADHGGVAHFWLHPENVATAPKTIDNLRAIVREAARLRDAGKLRILTQKDYCIQFSG